MTKRKVLILIVAVFMALNLAAGMAFAAPGNGNGNGNNGNGNNGNGNNGNGNNGNGNGNQKAAVVETVYDNTGNNGNQSDPIAPEQVAYPLHQYTGSAIDWQGYLSGSDFGLSASEGALVPGYELGTDGTVLWHFVNPDKLGGYADITFIDENGKEVTITNVQSYKNNQHFAVVTPQTWQLLSATYYPATAPATGATQFNLSHTAAYVPDVKPVGALQVSAGVNKEHEVTTWHDLYQRTVQRVLERTSQNLYKPTFTREQMSSDQTLGQSTKTLVSWLGDAAGGTFKNGHTYVEVNVAAASTANGVWYGIADSSPQNRSADYQYNVKIADGKLTVSFPDSLIAANVGAEVVANPADFSGNAPKHYGNSVTVDMPATYGDTVYLYFHNQGAITWYATDENGNYIWEFTGWQPAGTQIGSYKLVATNYGDYELVGTRDEAPVTVSDAYDVDFGLVVTDANGAEVYNGTLANNDSVNIPDLLPGDYTCALTGDDIGALSDAGTVVADQTTQVTFNPATVIGAPERVQGADQQLRDRVIAPERNTVAGPDIYLGLDENGNPDPGSTDAILQ